jgi:hypothetical protein
MECILNPEVLDDAVAEKERESAYRRLCHLEEHDAFVASLESDLAAALFVVTRESDGPLSERPFNDPARALWRKATSGVRQAARIEATVCAARLEAAKHCAAMTANSCTDLSLLSAVWLLIDLVGHGGSLGLGNGSSAREGAFSRLGKGRRQASDGACWFAAAEVAYQRLITAANADRGCSAYFLRIVFDADCGVVVELGGGLPVDRDDPTQDALWTTCGCYLELFPLAGLALLHATTPDSCPSHADAWVKFDLTVDQAATWFTDVQSVCVKHSAEVNANPNLRW